MAHPTFFNNEDIEQPSAGDDESLVKVRAASVNPLDLPRLRMGLR